MWKAGLTDYAEFAHRLLERITEQPISFEVVADDESEIRRQAHLISGWGANVYVKVPVTTSCGESLAPLVRGAVRSRRARERDSTDDTQAGRDHRALAQRRRSELRLGVRRPRSPTRESSHCHS